MYIHLTHFVNTYIQIPFLCLALGSQTHERLHSEICKIGMHSPLPTHLKTYEEKPSIYIPAPFPYPTHTQPIPPKEKVNETGSYYSKRNQE